MNSLLDQLHDIEGLDVISAWPLAPGWWALILIGFVISVFGIGYGVYKFRYNRSWKSDTLLKLSLLEESLSEATSRESLILLSEYLKRIALRRFPRNECAGLSGEAWLEWLTLNDPKQFDWKKQGTLLIEVPYAPFSVRVPVAESKNLIRAVKNWVPK